MITRNIIIYSIVVIAILGAGYTAFDRVRDMGYNEAAAECTLRFDKYKTEVDNRMLRIETSINGLGTDLSANNSKLVRSINTSIDKLKLDNKPIIEIVEGKCVPSKEYIETLNSAINKVNGIEK